MNESDFIPTETHDGVCSHCRSKVPLDATTCHGCGAFWGFRNGMSRDQLYRDANDDIRIGLGYIAVMALILVLGVLGLEFMLVLFLIGVLFSLKFLASHLLAGLLNRRTARKASSDEIDWWLKK